MLGLAKDEEEEEEEELRWLFKMAIVAISAVLLGSSSSVGVDAPRLPREMFIYFIVRLFAH